MSIGFAYLVVLSVLACFGAHRLHLLWVLRRSAPQRPAPPAPARWPLVTVQLPIYNEANCAARLIDAVARLDYPRHALEVQVLDDSTDATREVVDERVAAWRAEGVDMRCIRRERREGFKAGALAHGLTLARGGLLAIFDADFVPPTDFLRRTVPHFSEPRVGLVQARWGHLNREQSVLTRLQALALDAHFRIEQAARSRSGRFFNFNGTAGVFRREAIVDAGGWSADTITEDLDLSFRAQLCGWRFVFLDDLVVPAELPADLHAFRTQQQRWTRGSAQTARKLLRYVWSAPEVPLRARLEATFQLSLNAAYPCMLLLVLLTVPLVAQGYAPRSGLVVAQCLLVGFASGAVALFYLAAQDRRRARQLLEVLGLFACGLGISVSNGWAFFAGLFGGRAAFVRTPKAGDPRARHVRYRARRLPWLLLTEAALTIYLGVGVVQAARETPHGLPFVLLAWSGFAALTWGNLRAWARGRRSGPTTQTRSTGQVARSTDPQVALPTPTD